MTRLGLDMSAADLEALGYRVVDGKTVPVAEALNSGTNAPVAFMLFHGPSKYGRARNGRAFRSKWEAEYHGYLSRLEQVQALGWFGYECLKLRLADDTYWTPDFAVLDARGLMVHEVKGHWRDTARVKVKVAASLYPWLPIRVISKTKGNWTTLEVFNG